MQSSQQRQVVLNVYVCVWKSRSLVVYNFALLDLWFNSHNCTLRQLTTKNFCACHSLAAACSSPRSARSQSAPAHTRKMWTVHAFHHGNGAQIRKVVPLLPHAAVIQMAGMKNARVGEWGFLRLVYVISNFICMRLGCKQITAETNNARTTSGSCWFWMFNVVLVHFNFLSPPVYIC